MFDSEAPGDAEMNEYVLPSARPRPLEAFRALVGEPAASSRSNITISCSALRRHVVVGGSKPKRPDEYPSLQGANSSDS